jgi:hypothetical protein
MRFSTDCRFGSVDKDAFVHESSVLLEILPGCGRGFFFTTPEPGPEPAKASKGDIKSNIDLRAGEGGCGGGCCCREGGSWS